jgi:transposase InsO family protein
MAAEKGTYPVAQMARLLGVDRRRFYQWVKRRRAEPSARQQRMDLLVGRVVGIHDKSDGTYGARRVHAELVDDGWVVSVKTVAKAMRLAGIEGISPRTFHPPTTTPGLDLDPAPDLVARRFDMGAPDEAWFSDITYLPTGQGWAYLCAVKDGHSRRVLGRQVADHLRADLVEEALKQAVALRGNLPKKVIFHADRGTQYTSKQVADLAVELPICRSMGHKGVCWDNAAAESFWSTFKTEYYDRHVFTTIAQARRATYVWIDSWYNAHRRHSAIGYMSPLDYEQRLIKQSQKQQTNCPD